MAFRCRQTAFDAVDGAHSAASNCHRVVALEQTTSRGAVDILIGAQSCGLDRVGAEAAQHRRQGQARQHHQAGQSIFAVAAGGWRNGGHPLRAQARNREAPMARPIDGTSTNQGRGRSARQQDCADGLGHHGPRREIQGAEAVAGGMRQASSRTGNTHWRGHDDVMQIWSFRGSGEPAWVNAPLLKCVFLFGTRSAQSIRASGHTCRITRPDT